MEELGTRRYASTACEHCGQPLIKCKCIEHTIPDLSRRFLSYAIIIACHLRVINMIRLLESSSFGHHRRIISILRTAQSKIDDDHRGERDSANVIYIWMSASHKACYIGKTIRGFGTRCAEHFGAFHSQQQSFKMLPFHREAHRLGWYHFVPFPVISVANCSAVELGYIERQMIAWVKPGMNMPYVRKHVVGGRCALMQGHVARHQELGTEKCHVKLLFQIVIALLKTSSISFVSSVVGVV